MIAADIQFQLRENPGLDRDALREAIKSYLAWLRKNGQILGEWILADTPNSFRATVYLAAANALEDHHHSGSGRQALDTILRNTHRPALNLLEDLERRTDWSGSGSLYLFTHFLDLSSPVCAGDDGSPVPLYNLPILDREKEELHAWASAYRNYDWLAIDSGALEIPAYKQLAEVDSELARKGRALAEAVEKGTGLPVYYYQHRYWGRCGEEEKRICPDCGQPWTYETAERKGIAWFDFLCEPCRLVSHNAVSFDDDEHARIGEFRRPSPDPV